MANNNSNQSTIKAASESATAAGAVSTHSAAGGTNNGGAHGVSLNISSKPTLITTQSLRFLIMDAPRQSNLHLYIKECKRHHVTDIVRVCEPTYLGAELKTAGMTLHEMAYEDGHSPPEDVLTKWLELVQERFFSENNNNKASSQQQQDVAATIAVHCVAGLGRAPVLVAIALMEFENIDAVEAVMMIRKNRRGAINEKQLQYLEGYKCRMRKGEGGCACAIL
jgi:protein tyrosine phosphatase type 4A